MVEDVCVHAPDQATHDERLFRVLERLSQKGVTLNYDKCKFNITSFKFLGVIIDSDGIRPDPEKVRAI